MEIGRLRLVASIISVGSCPQQVIKPFRHAPTVYDEEQHQPAVNEY
jgi:hypothetical protein